jgi:membrane-associated phospholipid phosphatase
MRPNIPFDGCGNYANSKYDINSWGMPSGHSQGVCFAAVFWIIYIYKYTNLSSTKKLLSSLTLAFLALSVMYSRFVEGCHNFEQIGIGGFIGSVLGYYFFIFLEKYTDTLKN